MDNAGYYGEESLAVAKKNENWPQVVFFYAILNMCGINIEENIEKIARSVLIGR